MRRLYAFVLASQLLGIAPPLAAMEPEVPDAALVYAENEGVISRMDDGEFHPELPLTRADLVQGIVRHVYTSDLKTPCYSLLSTTPKTPYSLLFSDVTTSASFGQELCVGMLSGIAQGRTDGTFRPFDGATVSEVVKVIAKAYGFDPGPSLLDLPGIRWHERFWYELARREALPEGIRNNRGATVTRGEFAMILWNIQDEKPVSHVASLGARESSDQSVQSTSAAIAGSDAPSPGPETDAGKMIQEHVSMRLEARLAAAGAGSGV